MKRMMKKTHKGFTLVELIVTIAILGIVLVAVFNFFIFNLNTFGKGEDLSAVQFDVRMASEFVTKELRNVTVISDTDDTLASALDLTLLSDKYSSVNSVSFEITHEGLSYFVNYTIEGNSPDGSNSYSVTTRVLLNNIKSATLATSDTLYYSK